VGFREWWANQQVFGTLDVMAANVNADLEAEPVLQLARRLVTSDPRYSSPYLRALIIRAWLAGVWKFVDDPYHREHLRTPVQLIDDYHRLGYIPGDCDEAATLGAALGKAVGLRAMFAVLAFEVGGNGADIFSHVYTVLLTDDDKAIDLDVTRPAGPVPEPTQTAMVDV
jgi:hypothetical protein